MDTLILYYSYTGNSKKLAEKLSAERGADIAEITTPKRPSPLKVFFCGCPDAIRGRGWSIDIKGAAVENYSNIVLIGPVWAGNFAPPIVGAAELIPPGKNISLISVSGGTGVNFDKVSQILKSKNCVVTECVDYVLKGRAIKGQPLQK